MEKAKRETSKEKPYYIIISLFPVLQSSRSLMSDLFFRVKRLRFEGKPRVPYLLQNENGPCPLLAIANILMLRGVLPLHPDIGEISQQQLISLMANILLEAGTYHKDDLPSEFAANLQQNLADALELLPSLALGMTVNVRFDGVKHFEFTNEIAMFDLLELPLVHGWLYDPQDTAVAAAVGVKSYNQLMNLLAVSLTSGAGDQARLARVLSTSHGAHAAPSDPSQDAELRAALALSLGADPSDEAGPSAPPEPEPAEVVRELVCGIMERAAEAAEAEGRRIAEAGASVAAPPPPPDAPAPPAWSAAELAAVMDFLESSSNQLTAHGLFELHSALKDGELAVFFRNNHFGVLYKRQGSLFSLVTDQGYEGQPVVWERIMAVDGDTQLVDSDFIPVRQPGGADGLVQIPLDTPSPGPSPALPSSGAAAHHDEDADLALAMSLQMQEEEAYNSSMARQGGQQEAQGGGARHGGSGPGGATGPVVQNPLHARGYGGAPPPPPGPPGRPPPQNIVDAARRRKDEKILDKVEKSCSIM